MFSLDDATKLILVAFIRLTLDSIKTSMPSAVNMHYTYNALGTFVGRSYVLLHSSFLFQCTTILQIKKPNSR